MTELADQNGIVLADLPAGPTERRIAFSVGLGLLGIAAAVAPLASIQLPRIDAWIPITSTYIFLADLVTWVDFRILGFRVPSRDHLLCGAEE